MAGDLNPPDQYPWSTKALCFLPDNVMAMRRALGSVGRAPACQGWQGLVLNAQLKSNPGLKSYYRLARYSQGLAHRQFIGCTARA